MAYSTSNPPALMGSPLGGPGPRVWSYRSTDAEAAFDDTDYITNARTLGMATGDVVFVMDTTNSLSTLAQVTVDADGNGTLTALTAIA
jgi:hypothetical protein